MSSRAFSAKSGQSEAGSTTTGSSFLPSKPPFLFCASIIIRIVSLRVVSLMAIVPDRECRIPTLIVSCAAAIRGNAMETKAIPAASSHAPAGSLLVLTRVPPGFRFISTSSSFITFLLSIGSLLNGYGFRNLDLKAKTGVPRIEVHFVETLIGIKRPEAGIELLDDVAQVHFRGVLAVALELRAVLVGFKHAFGELSDAIFAEKLEFPD